MKKPTAQILGHASPATALPVQPTVPAQAPAEGTIPKVPNPTIKLTLDDDTVLECAVLTTFPVEGFGEYIALVPLNENGKSPDGETYLFRYAEEGDNPVVTNIEREDEYMAAAEAFHDFIANLKSEKDL